MPSVLAVHAGSGCAASAVAELRAGGVVTTNALDPMVAGLIDVMINPSLVVTTEVGHTDASNKTPPRLSTFWHSANRAVVGQTKDRRRFQLQELEPVLLPFHMAQAVGLTPRSHPVFDGGFQVPAGTLSRIEDLVAVNPAHAAAELATAGVAPKWADRLLAALLLRRSLWTIESVWLGGIIGKEESRLSVLDGGFAGYWRLSTTSDDNIIVAPSGFDDLLSRMAALLPGGK